MTPDSIRDWLQRWATTGSLSEAGHAWLMTAARTVLARHAAEVASVWPMLGMAPEELLSAFMERHGDGRRFAGLTLDRATSDREATGYIFIALENQFQDLVRAASPRRRLHRRLRESLHVARPAGLEVEQGPTGPVLYWSSLEAPLLPARIDDPDGRFRSEWIVQAACYVVNELARPVELDELVDVLADRYHVPETVAEATPYSSDRGTAEPRAERSACVRDEVAEAVLSFRKQLPTSDRLILDLFITGRTVTEIGQAVGRAKSTVSEAIDKRLIPALRDRLNPLVETTATVRSAMSVLEAAASASGATALKDDSPPGGGS